MFEVIQNIVFILGGIVLTMVVVAFLLGVFLRKSSSGLFTEKTQWIYQVLLPRERFKGEGRQTDEEKFKSAIARVEQLMAAVGGLRVPRGLGAWLTGRTADQLALEIVSLGGKISFYLVVPEQLVNYISQQLRSSYDEVELVEVTDYNIFMPQGHVRGAYIKLKKPYYLPIKTYRSFDSDPLESLTNVLSKLGQGENAALQFIVRSASGSWHMAGKQAAQRIKKGEELFKPAGGWLHKLSSGAGQVIRESVLGGKSKQPEPKEDKPVRLSPKEEETVKLIEDKNAKAGLEVNCRLLLTGRDEASIRQHLANMINSFTQYNIYEYGNELVASTENLNRLVKEFVFRQFHPSKKMILNTEELVSLFHFPLATTTTPNIQWLTSSKAPAPANLPDEGILLGLNVYRGQAREVRIKDDDRRRHVHIIGTTGTGKSYFMYNMALQDIQLGRGTGVVDPHGDFIDFILENIPKDRYDDVILFEPSNTDRPVGLNMLQARDPQEKDFVIQEMISIFYKLVPNPEMIGPMFEHNMRNAMLTLMADEQNPGTIAEIPRIFTDTEFQKALIAKLTDPVVRAFWEKEMAKTSDFHKSEMLGYLISKVGRFVENEMMRNIIGQARSGINFQQLMQDGKILLVNLAKGLVGEINSSLLGLIVVSKLQMAAFAQARLPQEQRRDFYLYIDEFQNYTTDSIATILSEARKYRLSLTMAHQYLGQLVKGQDASIREAVLGNVGTMVSFRIGVEDAQSVAQQMAPVFGEYDLLNLEKRNACIKMLIDNTVQRAFSLVTVDMPQGDPGKRELLREMSALKYGRPRAEVEQEILTRSKLGDAVQQTSQPEVERTL